MADVIIDCLLDTLKIFPFLFVLYLLIELLEHKTKMGKPFRALSGKAAPLVGSAAGLIPMCGFSVMAAKLYERKYVTLGTLLAVFIATSDEAFLVLALSSMSALDKVVSIALMCLIKIIVGAGIGYLVDFVDKKRRALHGALPQPQIVENTHERDEHEHEHEHEHDECEHEHEHEHECADGLQACEHKHESGVQVYLLSPLLHALQIAAVILLFNFAFGTLFYLIGEDNVIGFLQGAGLWYQPLMCCLVAIVPNCASSVILAEVYAIGGVTFGSCLGGLITNAGLGVLFLFRNAKAWKRNLAVLGATFLIGLACGYLVNLIGLLV